MWFICIGFHVLVNLNILIMNEILFLLWDKTILADTNFNPKKRY